MSNETTGLFSYRNRQRFWNFLESPYIVHLVLILTVIAIVGPLFWELLTSFKTDDAVYNLTYLPQNPTLQTYYQVLIKQSYWKAIRNSLIISLTSMVVVMVLGVPAGYAFSRYRFRGDNLVFLTVLFARFFPPIGLVVPYYHIMAAFNLINTKVGIIIANIYLWLPLVVYMMRNFFITIPREVDEAAKVDGCTEFQAFWHVVLPMARPGIAASAVLTFLYSWREFLFGFIVSQDLQSKPISVAVYNFVGDVSIQWASMAAAAIIAIIPAVLVVVFFQRYIVTGLSGGAVKG